MEPRSPSAVGALVLWSSLPLTARRDSSHWDRQTQAAQQYRLPKSGKHRIISGFLVIKSFDDERGCLQIQEVLHEQACAGHWSDDGVRGGCGLDAAWAVFPTTKTRACPRVERFRVPERLRELPRLQREYGLRPFLRILSGVSCTLK